VGETVNVAILDRDDVLYLDQMAGPSSLQTHLWAGRRLAVHATSNGKVLLAHASSDHVDRVTATPLPALTERTITDAARLRKELEEVRTLGYAVAIDELEAGLTAVAAPIYGADGVVIASVSVSGPTFRLPDDRLPEVIAQVMEAAVKISARMGHHKSDSDRALTR
jgi:DNA-binding IclR family transcriptional regulator